MSLLVKIGADLSSFKSQMKKATKEIQFVADELTNVGSNMSTKITLPLAGIGGAAIKVGMDFDSAMSEVAAISGATGEELKAMEEAAREMGRNSSKSAKESADALKYMSLAGWDAETSINSLESVLKLSEAGGMDLASTSDLVTDSMASLGLASDQLDGYLDMVAQTSRKSNTDMTQLMDAMIIAGGTFKNLNVPLDEANAMLGILANRGTKGGEAGNALNSILVNLTSGAGQAGKAMEELGISAFDADGNFKGISEVLKEVGEKTAGMTEEQEAMYLSMIGGKEQLDTIQKLLSGVSDEYVPLNENIANSTGTLNEMSETMKDNTKGGIEKMMSSLQDLAIEISDILIPVVDGIVDKLQEWIDWFSSLDESTQKTILKVAGVVAAIGPLLIAVGQGIKLFGTLKAIGLLLAPVIGAISTPVLIVAGAIAALIAGGIALYKNWDTVAAKSKETWSSVKEAIRGPANAIIGFANSIIGAYERMLNGVGSAINRIPSISIPDWVPMFGGKSYGIPNVPRVSLPRVPQLATGTNYVPHDMLAVIHKGEAVVPKKYNPANNNNSIGGSKRIEIPLFLDGYEIARATYDHIDGLFENNVSTKMLVNGVR